MKAVWSQKARLSLRETLIYLKAKDPAAARRAKVEILAATERLARRPQIARLGPWPNSRLWSLPRWHKILVIEQGDFGIRVLALLDTRRPPPDALD